MKIELSPHPVAEGLKQTYSARFTKDRVLVAEITDAPHDIVTRWAQAMQDIHDGEPEIKRLGICYYCGSTKRNDPYCGDCARVLRD